MSTIIYPTTNLNQIEQLRICRGDGIYVYDEDGKCYLEGLSGLWCASLGYANEELIDAIPNSSGLSPIANYSVVVLISAQ